MCPTFARWLVTNTKEGGGAMEICVGIALIILCLCVLVDKLHKSDKDLHINKEGLEVTSSNNSKSPDDTGKG